MLRKVCVLTIISLIMVSNLTAVASGAKTDQEDKQIVIVGWDGADWDLIEPLLEKDKLPHLKRLIEAGDRSSLRSSTPSMSPVAWTTFATGKNPGKHGIFSFLRKQGKDFIPLTGDDVEAKRIWDYTSDHNLTSLVINVPMTYPPHELKGKLIAGYLSLDNTTYTSPPSLQDKIEAEGYQIEALKDGFEAGKEDKFLQELNHTVNKRTEVALQLMDEEDWDLSIVVYTGLDRLQHYFWQYMRDDSSDYKTVIEDHYIKLDRQLGQLLEKTNNKTEVILLSDHGFGPLKGELYLNHWLREEGYLQLKEKDRGFLAKIGISQQGLISFLRDWGLFKPVKGLLQFLGLYDVGQSLPRPQLKDINFSETEAFATNFGGGIYITADNYEQVRNEIQEKLKELKHPKTGEKFLTRVEKKGTIYQGNMIDSAPDLMVDSEEWDPVGYLGYNKLASTKIEKSGKHRNYGILATNFALRRNNNSLTDVAPSVLNSLGLKVPEEIDGNSFVS